MEIQRVRIEDLFEKARQEAFRSHGPITCKVCDGEIAPEKRRGRPRLTCITCSVVEAAAKAIPPDPQKCERCGLVFQPQRKVARFCSDRCRWAAGKRPSFAWGNGTCRGCSVAILGRARKYCSALCRQQHKNALRRKSQAPCERNCPECQGRFMPWRAGVQFCSKRCAKRHADRNHTARRRNVRHDIAPQPQFPSNKPIGLVRGNDSTL
jgi:hypothetical protein